VTESEPADPRSRRVYARVVSLALVVALTASCAASTAGPIAGTGTVDDNLLTVATPSIGAVAPNSKSKRFEEASVLVVEVLLRCRLSGSYHGLSQTLVLASAALPCPALPCHDPRRDQRPEVDVIYRSASSP